MVMSTAVFSTASVDDDVVTAGKRGVRPGFRAGQSQRFRAAPRCAVAVARFREGWSWLSPQGKFGDRCGLPGEVDVGGVPFAAADPPTNGQPRCRSTAGAGVGVRLVALGARPGHVFAGLAAVTEAVPQALEEGRQVVRCQSSSAAGVTAKLVK